MNTFLENIFKFVFKVVEILLPFFGTKWAIHLFFLPFRFKRPYREMEFVESAEIKKIPLRPLITDIKPDPFYQTYTWGVGPTVLLVHGWSGRGTQMAVMVPELLKAGFKVIAFDAFAHGDSPGKKTNLLEFKQIIEHIAQNNGEFQAIIGHSLGGIAAALAITDGVQTQRLVTIGSPATMEYIVESFREKLNIKYSTSQAVTKYVEQLTGKPADHFSLSKIVERMNTEGLIFHDKNDKEAAYEQGLLLDKHWENGRLISTEGLGHQRILRDAEVIDQIVDFVSFGDEIERAAS